MFHIQADGFLNIACPLLYIFAGKAEHEVYTDVADANAAQTFYGYSDFLGVVAAM